MQTRFQARRPRSFRPLGTGHDGTSNFGRALGATSVAKVTPGKPPYISPQGKLLANEAAAALAAPAATQATEQTGKS